MKSRTARARAAATSRERECGPSSRTRSDAPASAGVVRPMPAAVGDLRRRVRDAGVDGWRGGSAAHGYSRLVRQPAPSRSNRLAIVQAAGAGPSRTRCGRHETIAGPERRPRHGLVREARVDLAHARLEHRARRRAPRSAATPTRRSDSRAAASRSTRSASSSGTQRRRRPRCAPAARAPASRRRARRAGCAASSRALRLPRLVKKTKPRSSAY